VNEHAKIVFCTYHDEKWTSLHQTNSKMILGDTTHIGKYISPLET